MHNWSAVSKNIILIDLSHVIYMRYTMPSAIFISSETMQLKKIKLVGFKSFVDPTVILLPSHLVAVVGPNGCGKSNIIDAVCWVLGETSAKYLRGSLLTDVIFNGSSSRKPVGQASVELVFDNQDGSIGGEYASYTEIAIKRQISRDGDSFYFLNGARCRRKDIVDIFLGTGLGPRSYSIIGQNMISRIIEAKPDEMRVYMEEAAGVSKYKERRRETENRIQHTKDNLARLNDIQAELEKQLASLQRQANAAEKFKVLKQQERDLRAQWQAVQWRDLDNQSVGYVLQIQQQETALEAKQADVIQFNRQIDDTREQQRTANESFQEVQKRYYTVGNEITRIEQEIRHHKERQLQWQQDLEHVRQNWEAANTSLEEMTDEMRELEQEYTRLQPESESSARKVKEATQHLSLLEEAMNTWQTRWDEFNQRIAKTTQVAQVEQTRIQHLEQRYASLQQRQLSLQKECEHIDFSQFKEDIASLTQQLSHISQQTQVHETALINSRNAITEQQRIQQQTTIELDEVRSQLQRLHGQQASLEALQQTALGQRDNKVMHWLAAHQLDKNSRLAQHIEVASGWELAVEKVLGTYLQAVCVDNLSEVSAFIDDFKQGNLAVFSTAVAADHSIEKNTANTLVDKIKSPWSLASLLSDVYVAETHEQAFALCKTLQAHESVITRDGLWMNPSWLRVAHDEDPAAGVFQREQELKHIAAVMVESTAQQNALETRLQQTADHLRTLEQQRDALQQAANQVQTQLAEVRANQQAKQERLTELTSRSEQLRNELMEAATELQQTQQDLVAARKIWQQAMQELDTENEQRNHWLAERDDLREQLQTAKTIMYQTKDEAHQVELRLQTCKSQEHALRQNITRMESQVELLEERKSHLQSEANSFASLDAFTTELNAALNQRLTIEEELNTARHKNAEYDQALRVLENDRHTTETEVAKCRDRLETLRLECQSYKVKSETLVTQITESGFQLETLLATLPEEANAEQWHAELEQITQRITRLGAINLVAIEEYASCLERKEYLDKQTDDLQQGLATLEDAIHKIDKETRARFKETFDKVNDRFQELFPLIFGGGKANLELAGENLLDAGITVMACPPGKRNSTIHLLSGGEKTLTAIALVFSIFHLNPAPFCLLDEVDAPLDDVNIGRFCQLVKNMAEKTQFIFISHNKLAIEMAEHLMGVTMHEPGVSRLVSVDIQEAVSLAGA
ncbi:hypothetical protein AYO45_00105 [Gammaproteobacteria bacterium SCGC AG-212-F23]|nr:hypothetical protein AYO45_00105 [Gammaproteobacteria bacterium SCGC AG-212-F23]